MGLFDFFRGKPEPPKPPPRKPVKPASKTPTVPKGAGDLFALRFHMGGPRSEDFKLRLKRDQTVAQLLSSIWSLAGTSPGTADTIRHGGLNRDALPTETLAQSGLWGGGLLRIDRVLVNLSRTEREDASSDLQLTFYAERSRKRVEIFVRPDLTVQQMLATVLAELDLPAGGDYLIVNASAELDVDAGEPLPGLFDGATLIVRRRPVEAGAREGDFEEAIAIMKSAERAGADVMRGEALNDHDKDAIFDLFDELASDDQEVAVPSKDLARLASLALRHTPDPDDRVYALILIGERKLAGVVPEVLDSLGHDDPEVVHYALQALRLGGAEAAVPRITPLLKDDRATVRAEAAWALETLGKTAAAIIPLLADDDADVRSKAHLAISDLAGADDIPALIEVFPKVPPDTRHDVGFVLEQLLGKHKGPQAASLVRDADAGLRVIALKALTEREDFSAASDAVRLLADPDADVRLEAMVYLGHAGAKGVAGSVAALLGHERGDVRWAVVAALRDMEAWEHLPDVVPLLADPDPLVRLHATKAVAHWERPESLALVARMMQDSDKRVRVTAAECACALGSTEGVAMLLESDVEVHRLDILNVLAEPEMRKRLKAHPLSRNLHADADAVLKEIAALAGLTVEIPESFGGTDIDAFDHDTLLGAISFVLGQADGPRHTYVLAPGRLRILAADAALAHWREWWSKRA